MSCANTNCKKLLNTHYYWCDDHWAETSTEGQLLISHRLNDPCYIHDTIIFNKCKNQLIFWKWPGESDDDDDDDEYNYLVLCMHNSLFKDCYKHQLIPNRLTLIIEEVKKAKFRCAAIGDGLMNLELEIHRYNCYTNFLTKWIEESKIIEKNNLIKTLPLDNDISNIVQHIVNQL